MRVVCIKDCAPWPKMGIHLTPKIGDRATVLEEIDGGYLLEEFPLPVGFWWSKEYFVPLEGDEIEEFERATGLDKYERKEVIAFANGSEIRYRT